MLVVFSLCCCIVVARVGIVRSTWFELGPHIGGSKNSATSTNTKSDSIPEAKIHSTNIVDKTLTSSSTASPPRLLFMAASYTMDQFLYLQKVLDCMRDICNAGWDVTVHLQVSNGLDLNHPRYKEISDRAYCIRSGRHIPIILEEYGQIGFGLNSKHRSYMRSHLDDFDYFSYAEEDVSWPPVIADHMT